MEIGCFLCENFMVRVRDVTADSGGHFLGRHGFIRHGDDPRDSRARHGRQRKHVPCNGFALPLGQTEGMLGAVGCDVAVNEPVHVCNAVHAGKMAQITAKALAVPVIAEKVMQQRGTAHTIRGVDFDLYRGETVAIVGESGSGKSVSCKAIMGILAPNAEVNRGEILFSYTHADGSDDTVNLLEKDRNWMRKHINGKRIAMVFQDPMTSLDPTMRIGRQIAEGMMWHFGMTKKEAFGKAEKLLEEVGITDAAKRMKQYPHQLSGGMRQRVVIAIALSCNPDLLICDEPTTALDVTIQAKILELICRIQKERGISVIYITHDLGVVAKVADYVNVMYAGKIVEKGTVNEIFYEPKHPYTWGLLSAMPDLTTSDARLYTIPGSPPNLLNDVPGAAFAPRKAYRLKTDEKKEPPMFKLSDTHYAATWLLDERAPKTEMPAELKARVEKMKKEATENGGL